jgi:VWFA-related protein
MARTLRTIAFGVLTVTIVSFAGHAQQAQSGGAPAQGQAPADQTAPPAATAQGGNPQSPVFRGGINFVRVDVIVSDKAGNPVADLKETDFEVTEDGKPQKVETFKLVELDGGLMPGPDGPPRTIRTDDDEQAEAAREDVRLFGVFLDDYHVRQLSSMSARQAISRFIETQLGPSDMVGVMYPLESIDSVRFTRNHAAVSKGIQQFLGRKFDYTPRNAIEEKYAHYPTEVVEKIRNQVSLSAIEGLIIHMGSLKEGRKALILVSEGYSNMLPPQMRDQNALMPGSGNNAAGNPLAGTNDPNEDRAAFFASTELQSDMREVFAAASRNNVAIYSVDPRGLATNEFGIDQNIGSQTDSKYLSSTMDTLRQLSEESDGRAIVNRNDLLGAMKQIVRDSSAYYLLGYTSTVAPSDGKFHEIKVRVKRQGIQVRSRKGYWALTASDVKRALAPPKAEPPKAVETALAAITAPTRARLVRTWIGTERGQNGKTKVTFVWEPVPRTAGDQLRSSEQPARVSLMASSSEGAPLFRGRAPDGLSPPSAAPATAGAAAAAAPASARLTFEVPPGKVQLRVAVEGIGSETLDSEVRELTVPDLTSPQTVIATPEVFRARTVRELQQIKSDPEAIPSAGREFRRTDRLVVKIPAYGPGVTPPTVTVRLLNRSGAPMNDVPVVASDGGGLPTIELALAGLATGEYLLEISATGSGGEAKELLGFRITG